MVKTCYALRLSARVIDLMFIGLIVLAVQKLIDGLFINPLLAYLLYGVVVSACDGTSLGKYLLSLKVQSSRSGLGGVAARIFREILLFILLPFVFLNFLAISPLPLHDRISGTKVVRDEI